MNGNQKRKRHNPVLLAALAGLVAPQGSLAALDLAQSPPGSVESYVAPNVIISVDDSGSMDFRLDQETSFGTSNQTRPGADGSWPVSSKRMNVLKHALEKVFSDTALLPDGKIRLAWQAMWNNGRSKDAGSVNSSRMNVNSMRPLNAEHRGEFLDFVRKLRSNGGTPTHKMLTQADSYLRLPLSKNGPWAAVPGKAAEPYLGCRRNYHIVMTDGRWNSAPTGGNKDGNEANLPDGTRYRPRTSQTNVYSDRYSDTLADLAFTSWAVNLQPALYDPGDVNKRVPVSREYLQAPDSENFGNDRKGQAAVLMKYWNPRYDPANWPHLVTYTIGFSNAAFTWPGNSVIQAPSEMVPFGFNGSFPDFVTGTHMWPEMDSEKVRALDLWHAALNGRGRFFAVERGEDLQAAFRTIVQQINTETASGISSVAASGSTITRTAVDMFVASYDPNESWKGWIEAHRMQSTGSLDPSNAWGGGSTADLLDDPAFNIEQRTVLTWGDSVGKGVPFRWRNDESLLSAQQKSHLEVAPDALSLDGLARERINFIRGDRSKEGSGPGKPFRNRVSRQGDIVNSKIWYVGGPASNYAYPGYAEFIRSKSERTPMIYVGGNDGMLHGFSAKNGSERIAFVPRGVFPRLGRLSDPEYDSKHQYYVDGSPMSGDIELTGFSNTPDWRTHLVGTLGGGGKGYFVLDITSPERFSETNAAELVLLDRTAGASEKVGDCATLPEVQRNACVASFEERDDIGHIFAPPILSETNQQRTTQITLLNNDRWAVILGNGYNSVNQRPVLLIQYLDGARELLRIAAQDLPADPVVAPNNGLTAPGLVDINGDGRPDVVYAGDLQGNMWKFVIASDNSADWQVAFDGQPLFTALGPEGLGLAPPASAARTVRQPITAPPVVRSNDRNKLVTVNGKEHTVRVTGLMVAFGTGRNITTDDPVSNEVQSIYAVLDNTVYKQVDQRVSVCSSVSDTGCGITEDMLPKPVTDSSHLVKRAMRTQSLSGAGNSEGRKFWAQDSVASIALDWARHKGWYFDLPGAGERLLDGLEFYDGSNVLAVFSTIPAKGTHEDSTDSVESCIHTAVDNERQYLSLLNIMDGSPPRVQVMDVNGDGIYGAADAAASRMTLPDGPLTKTYKNDRILIKSPKEDEKGDLLATLPEVSLRPNWRQLR